MADKSGITAISSIIDIAVEPATKKLLQTVLAPELPEQVTPRSHMRIEFTESGFRVTLEARDLNSYRSSSNSLLRSLGVILDVKGSIHDELHQNRVRRSDA